MPAPVGTAIQAFEEQNQKGFCGHLVQCNERTATVLQRQNSPIPLFCPRSHFQVSVMSQFLTHQRIAQLLDTQVVLGAVDGKSQALFFNLHAISGESQERLLHIGAYHNMLISIRSGYAIAMRDNTADF